METGTGKTMLAQALATETNSNFLYIRITDIIQPYVGESEKKVASIFHIAKSAAPCVIFFDEMQAIMGSRGRTERVSEKNGAMKTVKECDDMDEDEELDVVSDSCKEIVSQLSIELDSISGKTQENIVIVGATNIPWALDPNLLHSSRFAQLIHVSLPSFHDRLALLRLSTKSMPMKQDREEKETGLEEIALRTKGFSRADINNFVRISAFEAIKRGIREGCAEDSVVVEWIDLQMALKNCPATVRCQTEQKIAKWERRIRKQHQTVVGGRRGKTSADRERNMGFPLGVGVNMQTN